MWNRKYKIAVFLSVAIPLHIKKTLSEAHSDFIIIKTGNSTVKCDDASKT